MIGVPAKEVAKRFSRYCQAAHREPVAVNGLRFGHVQLVGEIQQPQIRENPTDVQEPWAALTYAGSGIGPRRSQPLTARISLSVRLGP